MIKNSKPQGMLQGMQSCGQTLQSIKHSNLQLEAGAYNRRKKIGISSGKEQLVLPLFYGNQERASSAPLKPKDDPQSRNSLFSLHNGVKYFLVAFLFSNDWHFVLNIHNKGWPLFLFFSQKSITALHAFACTVSYNEIMLNMNNSKTVMKYFVDTNLNM